MHGSYGQTALDGMGMEESGLVGAADGEEVRLPVGLCDFNNGMLICSSLSTDCFVSFATTDRSIF